MNKSKTGIKLIVTIFLLAMSLQSYGDLYVCKGENGGPRHFTDRPLLSMIPYCVVYIKTKPRSVTPTDGDNSSIKPNSKKIKLTKIGGVYEVPVKLNGVLNINFIFDSGASEVSITPDVALTLLRTGTIRENDWLPGRYYQLADGS